MKRLPFDQSRLDLLCRNEELVREVVKLRADNTMLKRKLNSVLIWKLSVPSKESRDVAVQTEYNLDNDFEETSISPFKFTELEYLTPEKDENSHPNLPHVVTNPSPVRSISHPNLNPSAASPTKKTPPSQERMTEKLTERLLQEHTPLPRAPRSVKKVVSYAEPSLRVKVRRGCEFFKFSDPDKEP
jgi:hypothetical protein